VALILEYRGEQPDSGFVSRVELSRAQTFISGLWLGLCPHRSASSILILIYYGVMKQAVLCCTVQCCLIPSVTNIAPAAAFISKM
jgi:hypothetical protein